MAKDKTTLIREIFEHLRKFRKAKVKDLSNITGEKFERISRLLYDLSQEDLVVMKKIIEHKIKPTEEAKRFYEEGTPEERLIKELSKGPIPIANISDKIALQWVLKNKWAKVENGTVYKVRDPDKNYIYRALLEKLMNGKELSPDEIKLLKKRKWIIEDEEVDYLVELTEKGLKYKVEEEITDLTKDLIVTGSWKTRKIKKFSVADITEERIFGRRHPVSAMIDYMKDIYARMGFIEENTTIIQTAFWNFDALMVPQDHPAREMQDTFYFEELGDLPPQEILKRVSEKHKYLWGFYNPEISRKLLLRTHMTVSSARTLASSPEDGRYFAIGKVFRNETVDYKHLAELHQVDGIVIGDDLTLRDLFGFLKEFFSQLGFEKIRLRPAYFPFTEPSVEIDVWFEEKNNWIELGGAGIFRQEISSALLGNDKIVLAWGLGVERLIMLRFGLTDIRELYNSRLEWLRRREVI